MLLKVHVTKINIVTEDIFLNRWIFNDSFPFVSIIYILNIESRIFITRRKNVKKRQRKYDRNY